MSTDWIVVLGAGAGTLLLKGLAPATLGGRELPVRMVGAVTLLGPALLAALIVTNTFANGRALVLDARAAGLAAAVTAGGLRAIS